MLIRSLGRKTIIWPDSNAWPATEIEPWIVPLMLTLAALYAVVVMGIYFVQTWLLFPTMLA
jgi:hypothetical protein